MAYMHNASFIKNVCIFRSVSGIINQNVDLMLLLVFNALDIDKIARLSTCKKPARCAIITHPCFHMPKPGID